MTVVEDQAENIRMLHDPEPKRIFLWRGAAKQRPAFHAQCSKPLLINKLAGSGLKVRPNRAGHSDRFGLQKTPRLSR
jgi:hypothetical protein